MNPIDQARQTSFEQTLLSARRTMLLSEILKIALDSFRASKARFALTALGMSAVLGELARAFEVLRWLGVAYLLWLGVSAWRAPPPRRWPSRRWSERSGGDLFRPVSRLGSFAV